MKVGLWSDCLIIASDSNEVVYSSFGSDDHAAHIESGNYNLISDSSMGGDVTGLSVAGNRTVIVNSHFGRGGRTRGAPKSGSERTALGSSTVTAAMASSIKLTARAVKDCSGGLVRRDHDPKLPVVHSASKPRGAGLGEALRPHLPARSGEVRLQMWTPPHQHPTQILQAEAPRRPLPDATVLALLAPDIVEAILAGRPDAGLMLESLERPLPMSWEEQRRHPALASGARS